MIFQEYFKNINFYQSKGRGISIYDCDSKNVALFVQQADENKINYRFLKTSDISEYYKLNFDINSIDLLIIHQNLKLPQLLENIDSIVNKIIFGAYYLNKPVIFFSALKNSEYILKIKGDSIHTSYEQVENLLLIEQLVNLLETVNFTFTSPSFTDIIEKGFYTPIEKLFKDACENNKITYKSQVHIENYFVDFIINYNGKKAIVECDGRDYHDEITDRERDKALSKQGIQIFHFSGSELYNNANLCLQKVIRKLSNVDEKKKYDLDSELDESQLKAIKEINGPIRVLAPAGSGKTKTLTNRIVHLINNGVDPSQILALAFNKRAAQVMIDRINHKGITVANKLTDEGVSIKTFHSFGYEVIKTNLHWNFNGDNEALETRKLMRNVVEQMTDIPGYMINETVDKYLEALRRSKLELPPIDNFTVELKDGEITFEPYFRQYLNLQFAHNFFNFDDMIYLALRIILENNVLRQGLQRRFNYILIDEFQDLNQAQILLMQVLALPTNNLFIVGDDDQMIYGFTGAKIEHIINFPERYSYSKEFTLSTNYRSAKKIVKHSSWLINNNDHRVRKNISPYIKNPTGELKISLADNLYIQAVNAVNWIKEKKKEHKYRWEDFTVLFRYYEFQYPIAFILDIEQIPHSPVNNQKLFRKAPGKDIYSYLTIILHPKDATLADFVRILKRPNKYINNNIIDLVQDWSSFLNLIQICEQNNIKLESWKQERIVGFINQIDKLCDYAQTINTPFDIVNSIVNEFELKTFYKDIANIVKDVDIASDDIIIEVILSVAKTFNSISTFYEFVHNQINNPDATPIPELDEIKNKKEILISTIHKTKGNEFKNVVYFNLAHNDKIRGLNEQGEERRICYVGVTRAIERIFISAPTGTYSKYLPELLKNPAFITYDLRKLNDIKNEYQFKITNLKSDITFNEKNIISVQENHPELIGEKYEINYEISIHHITVRIEVLNRKYPELKGEPLKTFPFFNNYFSTKRAQKINNAQEEIEDLKKEKQKIKKRLKDDRAAKVNKAKEEVNGYETAIFKLKDEVKIFQEQIDEINEELYFRELLKN